MSDGSLNTSNARLVGAGTRLLCLVIVSAVAKIVLFVGFVATVFVTAVLATAIFCFVLFVFHTVYSFYKAPP